MADAPTTAAGHPAYAPPVTAPAAPPPEGRAQPAAPDRTRGYSPRDSRKQQPAPEERFIEVAGEKYREADVTSAMARHVQEGLQEAARPSSPNGYELKLPDSFKLPFGETLELDASDPFLGAARELAHRHQLSQAQFSDFLAAFAANEHRKASRLNAVRQANLDALGSLASARLEGLRVFLTSRAGRDGAVLAEFARKFPSAPIIRALEHIQHELSTQGAAAYRQNGRNVDPPAPNIPTMESGASYKSVRAAQDSLNGRPGFAPPAARRALDQKFSR